jgi:hypothetical protein
MNPLLARELHDVLDEASGTVELRSERSLRLAATTIANARPHEISATRVVGVLGRDDLSLFEAMVARLGEEFELDATLRIYGGSFSVRFCRSTCHN